LFYFGQLFSLPPSPLKEWFHCINLLNGCLV